MSLTTIDYTVTADLFLEVDPAGLQQENSARAFQVELGKRLKVEFPKASIFLKWNPKRTGVADVFTMPELESDRRRVLDIADTLHADRAAWVAREGDVRAS